MDFKYKCMLQRLFSAIPYGETFNYILQKNILGHFPLKESDFLDKVNEAEFHYRNYTDYCKRNTRPVKYYEFGAGWDLIVPIYMSLKGCEVTCIDIKHHARKALVANSLIRLTDILKKKKESFNNCLNGNIPIGEVMNFLEEKTGLRYIAPSDARKTGFSDNTFDFVSSTATMEHIPEQDVIKVLKESYRILKTGGVFSLSIDYKDHWAYSDNRINYYNFLLYTPSDWEKMNPDINYQNRLRHPDYKSLIRQAGFEIISEIPVKPSDELENELKKMNLAKEYRSYSLDSVKILSSSFILKK